MSLLAVAAEVTNPTQVASDKKKRPMEAMEPLLLILAVAWKTVINHTKMVMQPMVMTRRKTKEITPEIKMPEKVAETNYQRAVCTFCSI